ncbi:hypothetical protein GQ457_15G018340 [Hibiscus cannabinus]
MEQKPCLVFLQESKLVDPKPSLLRKLWNGHNIRSSFSPSIGSVGGLISLWNSDVFAVSSQIITQRYIAIIGCLKDLNWDCGFLNIYGPSVDTEKGQFFSEISEFLSNHRLSWCVCGDFNLYLHEEEKLGGPTNLGLMEVLRNFIQESGLVDLPLKGGAFTWSNMRAPPTLVRLDRFLVSSDFLVTFQYLEQRLLSFEDMVISSILKVSGRQGNVGVMKVLRNAKAAIKEWVGTKNNLSGNSNGAIELEIKQLEQLQVQGLGNSNSLRQIVVLIAYNEKNALPVEEMDFHFNCISSGQQAYLEAEFTEEEVWRAISSSDSNKAPGPDGLNMGFFKRFWPQLKVTIMKAFDYFHRGKNWEEGFNHSFITLISKKGCPESLEDYRPISLVGGIYKILSKVIAGRLKCCMETVISNSQFAFIQGRQILDCSFIANECIDEVVRSKLRGVVFKIDFRRAYDTVDWGFLIQILKEMNFGNKWCDWIFKCVSTATISVLVNGVPTDRFQISRGFRQGCSLSTYLFNIVGEAVNKMISKAVEMNLFSGFKIGNETNESMVSHLQFADDLMIFCDASLTQIENVKRVLRVFELASGLQLNLRKCRIFGINVPDNELIGWASSIGCLVGKFPTEYLGLPLGPKRNSVALWDPILEKFHSRLASWKSNCLSFGGRLGYRANNFEIDWVRWEGAGDGKYSVKSLVNKCIVLSSSEADWGRYFGGGLLLRRWRFLLGLQFVRGFRNDIIFANGRLDVVQLYYLIRTRVATWYKAKFSDCSCTVDELISDPSVADSMSFSLSKVRKKLSWEAPPCGFLKLNVDGAMEGNGGKGGIGGLLRNNLGICLEKFSLPIGPGPPILAELEAILHGLKLFFSSRWCEKFRLGLECDCLTAID